LQVLPWYLFRLKEAVENVFGQEKGPYFELEFMVDFKDPVE